METEDKYIGRIFDSVNYGQFKIIEFVYYKNKHRHYVIEFLNQYDVVNHIGKYRTIAPIGNIRTGKVRDPYAPIVCGVACTGEPQHNLYYDREYYLWASIISRCYNINCNNYYKYGAKGVRVCKRWLCFANFQRDLSYINGYNNWLLFPRNFQLDKDKLQFNKPNNYKYYGPDTCLFLSSYENGLLVNGPNTSIPIYVISPYYNYYRNFESKSECERKLSIDHSSFDKYINTGNMYNNIYFYTNLKTVYRKVDE